MEKNDMPLDLLQNVPPAKKAAGIFRSPLFWQFAALIITLLYLSLQAFLWKAYDGSSLITSVFLGIYTLAIVIISFFYTPAPKPQRSWQKVGSVLFLSVLFIFLCWGAWRSPFYSTLWQCLGLYAYLFLHFLFFRTRPKPQSQLSQAQDLFGVCIVILLSSLLFVAAVRPKSVQTALKAAQQAGYSSCSYSFLLKYEQLLTDVLQLPPDAAVLSAQDKGLGVYILRAQQQGETVLVAVSVRSGKLLGSASGPEAELWLQ